jgi:hypothetical protein
MADNTGEEHVDKLANTQPANPPDGFIPAKETETINSNQQTDTMEVHHHSGQHHKSKKWKEYFIEFFMIFLAVTMGFFAESYREKLANHEKEKDYMHSMIIDLKADTASISETIQNYIEISKEIDTMLMCLRSDNPDPSLLSNSISRNFWTYAGYSYNNRTVQQLKNSGNFRLIRNNAVADSILNYDNGINSFVLNQYNDLKISMFSYKEVESKVLPYSELKMSSHTLFDPADFNNTGMHTFITHDKELLASYYNKLFLHGLLCHTFIGNLDYYQKKATRLIDFIEKGYHFK